MSIFVAEIDGCAVAAFDAKAAAEAREFVMEEFLRSYLMVLETEGKPLWNGMDEVKTRLALPAEANRFHKSLIDAKAKRKDDGDGWLCFLVPVIEPTDDTISPAHR